jgi:hypothetical protein
VVLKWCYSGVTVVSTVVLHWCYSGVGCVLQWCYSGVTVVLQCSIAVDSALALSSAANMKALGL